MSDKDKKVDVRSKIFYPSIWKRSPVRERIEKSKRFLLVIWLGLAIIVAFDVISGFTAATWRVRMWVWPMFIWFGFETDIFQTLWNHVRFERSIRKNRGRDPDDD